MLTGVAVAGPWEDGFAAYERGDYSTALKLWRPLAAQGNFGVQTILGTMYFSGEGVPQDDAEAVKWFRLAAEQGYAEAQYNLGFMYDNGRGVQQDYVLAHMWFNLAGYTAAAKNRDLVAKLMTPDQIAEAERLAREWRPKPER